MRKLPPIDWEGDLEDDCVAEVDGVLLRAEKMDEGVWWWAVYGHIDTSSNDIPGSYRTGQEARRAAEEIFCQSFDAETSNEAEVLALTLVDGKVRLVVFSSDGTFRYADADRNVHRILYGQGFISNYYRTAIEELEHLINNRATRELELQDFFVRYPDFILNDDYKAAHSQLILTDDDGSKLIPDFVLEPVSRNALCDLLELKLPRTKILRLTKNRTRFSGAVLEACAQLREYSDHFDDPRNRARLHARYGLHAYRPKLIVVIGRRGNMDPVILRKAQSDFPQIELKTYDEILERVRHKYL